MDCKEEIENVCDALRLDQIGQGRFYRQVFNRDASCQYIHSGFMPIQEEMQAWIHEWCNRIYMANQCAYIMTYSHREDCDRTISDISDKCTGGFALLANLKKFYETLTHIRYNLWSNGGNMMLSSKDEDRLNALIEVVAAEAMMTQKVH